MAAPVKKEKPKVKENKLAEMPSRDARLAFVLEKINKTFKGRAQLKRASEYTLPFMTKRLPTGLLSLDLELRGGFPAGGLSQIVGPKNSGKTYLAWQVIRQQQYYKGESLRVLLAQTEMRADRTQARLAGVTISLGVEDILALEEARIRSGLPKFTKEEREILQAEVGRIDELHGESAEDLYDSILLAVENNVYHVIVIDSFGSIMSAAEAESESLSEKQYSGASAVNTKFLRKLSAFLTMDDSYGRARDVCILGINQVRDNIGGGQGAPEYKSPGGKALEHAKFVDLLVQSGKKVGYEDNFFAPEGTKKQFVQTGKEVNWRIEKGKAGIHEGGKGSYIFDFRTGAGDFYMDTLVAGVRHGIIETAGSWLRLPNPIQPDSYLISAAGREKFINALVEDAQQKAQADDPNTLMNAIRDLAFKKEGIYINYDWE